MNVSKKKNYMEKEELEAKIDEMFCEGWETRKVELKEQAMSLINTSGKLEDRSYLQNIVNQLTSYEPEVKSVLPVEQMAKIKKSLS